MNPKEKTDASIEIIGIPQEHHKNNQQTPNVTPIRIDVTNESRMIKDYK